MSDKPTESPRQSHDIGDEQVKYICDKCDDHLPCILIAPVPSGYKNCVLDGTTANWQKVD